MYVVRYISYPSDGVVLLTESNVHKAQRELAEAQKWQIYILSVKEGVDTAVEQGLWVALMVDFGAISGKLYEKEDTFLWDQRTKLSETVDFLTQTKWEIPGLPAVPKPMGVIFRFLHPLMTELKKKGRDDDGRVYYAEMGPIPRMLLVFVLPGVLRLLAKQIGELVPL